MQMGGNPTYVNLRKRKKAKRAKSARRGQFHSTKKKSVKASAAPVGVHDTISGSIEGIYGKGGCHMLTSASGQAPRKPRAPSSLWRAEGYRKRYLWWHARAMTQLLRWSEKASSPPRTGKDMPVLAPSGLRRYDVFGLTCSMPFLLKSRDKTSLRGNTAGPDGKTYYHVFQCADRNNTVLKDLQSDLMTGRYEPGGYREFVLRSSDGNDRVLNLPNILDKIVSRAVAMALTAIFEPHFSQCSFGFRPGIAVMHAIKNLEKLCQRAERWVLQKLDITKAFDSVPHDRLLDTVWVRVKDRVLMEFIEKLVCGRGFRNRDGKTNVGLAMGDPLSPMLFNIYLDSVLDRAVALKHPEIEMQRWADDLILLCRDRSQAAVHRDICIDVLGPAGLTVNEKKTFHEEATADLNDGEKIEYLGFAVGKSRKGRLTLDVTDGAYTKLYNQTIQDVSERQPLTIPIAGKARALSQQVELRLAGFTEAYAAAIPDGRLHDFLGKLQSVYAALKEMPSIRDDGAGSGTADITWPSRKTMKRLWRRGRELLGLKDYRTVPDAYHRIILQRAATASHDRVPPMVRDHFEDGDGLVPAPSGCVEPYYDRRPQAEEEEWRVGLALIPPRLDESAGAAGVNSSCSSADPRSRRITISTDGASRGNPGPAAWAYVARYGDGREVNLDCDVLPVPATNMMVEYEAIIHSLTAAFEGGWKDDEDRSDRSTVVRQLVGIAKVNHPAMRKLHAKAIAAVTAIAEAGGTVEFTCVPRRMVEEADELVNAALDQAEEDAA